MSSTASLAARLAQVAVKLREELPLGPAERATLNGVEECFAALEVPMAHAAERRLRRRMFWPLACAASAAASFVVALTLFDAPHGPGGSGLGIEHVLDTTRGAERRVDRFLVTSKEPCVLAALLKTWDPARGALAWTAHRWESGAVATRLARGGSLAIELDVSTDPAVKQLIVVATASDARWLPQDEAAMSALIDCLGATELRDSGSAVADALAAAASCLAPDVRLMAREFVVQK